MGARAMKGPATAESKPVEAVNEVRLVGRVSQPPDDKVLPSGDTVATFRMVVDRLGDRGRSKQTVDVLDCAVWNGRLRRSISTWSTGDVVEVSGSVRRRFFRGAQGTASRVEVEVARGRVIRRAATS